MISIKWCVVASFIFFFQLISAQEKNDSLIMQLNLRFGKEPLELNKTYISKSKDTLQVDLFKFYISNIQIKYADNSIYNGDKTAHLIDIENINSTRIPLSVNLNKKIASVTFNIGVDSLSSVSGALSGDLDPTKGMYWAWQSGFINMKIEGRSKSCKTRKNEFQFHIGGYLKPNYAMRSIQLKPAGSNLNINVDVSQLFDSIQLSKSKSIMIPGKEAMRIADQSISMFSSE